LTIVLEGLRIADVFLSAIVAIDPQEANARTVIAAALIVRGAAEVPSMPPSRHICRMPGMRLRELPGYVYRLLTTDLPHAAVASAINR